MKSTPMFLIFLTLFNLGNTLLIANANATPLACVQIYPHIQSPSAEEANWDLEDRLEFEQKRALMLNTLAQLQKLTGSRDKNISLSPNFIQQTKNQAAQLLNKIIIATNAFITNRDLETYHLAFGEQFTKSLSSLSSYSHWIDVGAGAARAMLDFIKQSDNPLIRTTAISVNKPIAYSLRRNRLLIKNPRILRNHQYLSGQYLEDLATNKLAPADLITDLFGAFSYSPHIDQVLQKEISMLKKGGKLFVFSPVLMQINLVDANGNKVSILDWLKRIQGVRVFSMITDQELNAEHVDEIQFMNGFYVLRTDQTIAVPSLVLLDMSLEVVSERTYLWNP